MIKEAIAKKLQSKSIGYVALGHGDVLDMAEKRKVGRPCRVYRLPHSRKAYGAKVHDVIANPERKVSKIYKL